MYHIVMNYNNSMNMMPYTNNRTVGPKLPKVERKMTVVSAEVAKKMTKKEIEAVVAKEEERPVAEPVSIAITQENIAEVTAKTTSKKKSTRKKSKTTEETTIVQ
jgi:hypothetical protein